MVPYFGYNSFLSAQNQVLSKMNSLFAAASLLLLGLWVTNAELVVCVPRDYSVVTSGPCVNGSRNTSMSLPPDASCSSASPVLTIHRTCDCEMTELEPALTSCVNNLQNISGYVKRNASASCSADWAVHQLPRGPVPCVCTTADIGYTFSKCSDDDNSMSAVSYWKRSCSIFDGLSLSLPDMRGVAAPCDASCSPGEVLQAPDGFCTLCSAGTYSLPGHAYGPPYTALPPQTRTRCFSTVVDHSALCNAWAPCPDRTCFYSGNNFGLDNIASRLDFHIVARRADAFMSFMYMTDIEKDGDYLIVLVNDRIFAMQTGYNDWEYASVPLVDTEFVPPAALCKWSVFGECIEEPQLIPYNRNLFFRENSPLVFNDRFFVASGDVCTSDAFSAASIDSVVLVDVAKWNCTVEDVMQAMITSGVVAVALFNRDSLASTGGHLIGKAPSGTPNIIFGVVSNTSMVALTSWTDDSLSGNNSSTSSQGSSSVVRIAFDYNPNPFVVVTVTIEYLKDGSASVGSDTIKLREITISGTSTFVTSCAPCKPGYYSLEGAAECLPCAKNTFSDSFGADSCQNCPEGQAAAEGAQSCSPLPPCSIEHYGATHGPCLVNASDNSELREVTMSLSQPLMCNPLLSSSISPPAPRMIPCGSCDVGSYRDLSVHRCRSCPSGYVASTSPPHCRQCDVGTVAMREIVFSNFDILNNSFPDNWTPRCSQCISSGFHFETTPSGLSVISVGSGVPTGASATLSIGETFVAKGSLSFNYSYTYEGDSPIPVTVLLQNWHGETTSQIDVKVTAPSGVVAEFPSIPIPMGAQVVVLRFIQSVVPVKFTVSSIRMTNGRSGGSRQCVPCPAGFTCPAGAEVPQPCPPGTAASQGSAGNCSQCALPMEYSQFTGEAACANCMPGTVALHNQACGLESCILLLVSTATRSPLVYNLSSFSALSIRSDEPTKETQSHLALSLCQPQQAASCGQPEAAGLTYGCVTYYSASLPVGADYVIDFGPANATGSLGTVDGPHLSISFNGGPCYMNSSSNLTTRVALKCDALGDPSVPPATTFRSLVCHNEVEVVSPFACPTCTNDSFVGLQAPCADGKAVKTYFYKAVDALAPRRYSTEPTCFGGLRLPLPTTTLCVDGAPYESGSFGASQIIIVAGAVAIIALSLIVVALYRSRREIAGRYSTLQSNERVHLREMSVVAPSPPEVNREDTSNIVTVTKVT